MLRYLSSCIEDQEKFLREVLRCLFLQLRISLEKQNLVWKLALKVYVGGKKLYNVEIESIVEESHLEKVA